MANQKKGTINYRDEYFKLVARAEHHQDDIALARTRETTAVTYAQRLTLERAHLRAQIVQLLGMPVPAAGPPPGFFDPGGPIAIAVGATLAARYGAMLATLQPIGGAAGADLAAPGGAAPVTPATPQPAGAALAATPAGVTGLAGPQAPTLEELDLDLDHLFGAADEAAAQHIGDLLDPHNGLATPVPFTPDFGPGL